MKKRITQRAVAGLLVVLALAFTAGATSAFVGAKPFYLDAPLRFDYVPSGAGDKPILATDLDGNYVKAVAHSNQAITVTLQDGQNAQHTLSIPIGATLTGATLTGATYVADTETLTLTLSEGDPITADLSGLTTSSEVATAISAAIAAETDAVLTGATYAADTKIVTLTLSEGTTLTVTLSDLTTSDEVAATVSDALANATDATVTGASFAADTQTFSITLSEGGPVTASLSDLTTETEVSTAITTALAGVVGTTVTGASYADDTELLTITLSDSSSVTADLSNLTTSSELSAAMLQILSIIAGSVRPTVTGASFATDTKILSLTLSSGDPITANLSSLSADAQRHHRRRQCDRRSHTHGNRPGHRRRLPDIQTHKHRHPTDRLGHLRDRTPRQPRPIHSQPINARIPTPRSAGENRRHRDFGDRHQQHSRRQRSEPARTRDLGRIPRWPDQRSPSRCESLAPIQPLPNQRLHRSHPGHQYHLRPPVPLRPPTPPRPKLIHRLRPRYPCIDVDPRRFKRFHRQSRPPPVHFSQHQHHLGHQLRRHHHTDELAYFSNQGSTASILYRAADFNSASAHMAFAIRSPSMPVTSLTSTVGGTNLCMSGLWSPCRSNAQITINNRLWNVYVTSSAVALPADAVGLLRGNKDSLFQCPFVQNLGSGLASGGRCSHS